MTRSFSRKFTSSSPTTDASNVVGIVQQQSTAQVTHNNINNTINTDINNNINNVSYNISNNDMNNNITNNIDIHINNNDMNSRRPPLLQLHRRGLVVGASAAPGGLHQ